MITKETFEQLVPSFRDCEGEIFESIEVYLQKVEDSILKEYNLSTSNAQDATLAPLLEAYVCKRTAYEALPHLDLILTANGFAVTSNQNLSPASRQRVEELRERLRREKSDARDALMEGLATASLYAPGNLIWNPSLARRYGIRTKDGKQVYEEEMQLVQPDIDAAQHKCAMMVSEEQMEELVTMQETMFYNDLTDLCRRFMASLIKGNAQNIKVMAKQLQGYLNTHADELPTYRASSKYEADHFQPYENKRDDACFFFG